MSARLIMFRRGGPANIQGDLAPRRSPGGLNNRPARPGPRHRRARGRLKFFPRATNDPRDLPFQRVRAESPPSPRNRLNRQKQAGKKTAGEGAAITLARLRIPGSRAVPGPLGHRNRQIEMTAAPFHKNQHLLFFLGSDDLRSQGLHRIDSFFR